jgi:hypothetical protein
VLRNAGSIDETSIEKTKISGAPPAGTKTTIVDNVAGSKMKSLKLNDTQLNFVNFNAPIPPPDHPNEASTLSYKSRVGQLAGAVGQWYGQNVNSGPDSRQNDDAYKAYRTVKMGEFHNDLGKQIMVLMQELRSCHFQDVSVNRIYWREDQRDNPPEVVNLQAQELGILEMELPDKDIQLQCVAGGEVAKRP